VSLGIVYGYFYKYNSHEHSYQWLKKIVPRGGAIFSLAHRQILACYGHEAELW